MFKIYDGRNQFYQWDLDRRVIVDDTSINEVHFCNRTDDCSLVCEVYEMDGLRVANVPNVLLQDNWRINVYAYDTNYTKHCEVFDVVKRTKPADYIYTETEIKNYDDLVERIDQIEKNGVSDEKIADAVNAYLEENPIEVDLTGLATESYVDEKFNSIEIPDVDLTGYATETFVKDEIQKAQLSGGDVDLSDYYTKSEVDKKIEDIELTPGSAGKDGYTPVKGVDYFDGVDGAPGKDGQDYVLTEADKEEIAGLIEVPDVSGFQTAEQVQTAISQALGEIGVAEEGAY